MVLEQQLVSLRLRGGTEYPPCDMGNNTAAFEHWIHNLADAVEIFYSAQQRFYPHFKWVHTLFDNLTLGTVYQAASEAYHFWAGVEGLRDLTQMIVQYLQDWVTESAPECNSHACGRHCPSGNDTLLPSVQQRGKTYIQQPNDTPQDMDQVLKRRAITGYEVLPHLANLAKWIKTITEFIALCENVTHFECKCFTPTTTDQAIILALAVPLQALTSSTMCVTQGEGRRLPPPLRNIATMFGLVSTV